MLPSFDSNGLIVQTDGDGGDTAGREGDYWFAQALYSHGPHGLNASQLEEFDRVIELLQPSPGIFVRNPTRNPVVPPAKAWNDPSDFSRDQTIPIILALGEMGHADVLKKLFWQQLKRYTLYQNGDIATPQDLGYYIRANREWYLYPLLFIGDLFTLGNSVIRCIKGRNLDDVSDDINHTLALLQAQRHYPTPISYLARKIYKYFRPGGVQAAWDHYFRPETGANPFNDMYRNLITNL